MPLQLELEKVKFYGAHVKAVGDKSTDAPHGWVEGIANAFEVDRYGDLVLPTAMGAAVDKFMRNPVLTFGHNLESNPANGTLPAGTVLSITQDGSGNTIFRARWASTADAQKVRQMYVDGDMRAFSIHFLPYGDSMESRQPTADEVAKFPGVERVITKLELIEIACCAVPVNAGSLVTGAKSMASGKPESQPTKLLKPSPIGERAMSKSILTSDMRKSIGAAHKAYDAHVKSMEAVAGHLEELAESKEGAEADHGAMSSKCKEAFAKAEESHKALGESVKAMHTAITNEKDEAAEGDDEPAEPADDGSAPLPTDPEEKALVLAFQKALA